jgi:uncharacterized coiled-coil DUF342 family protein
MNKEITAAMMFLRDMLKDKAAEVMKPVEEELKNAKAKHHDAKILSNQLLKHAQKIQSLITVEMQAEYNQAVEAEDAWEVKGNSEMKDQTDCGGNLMDLIKKVN